MATKSQSFSKIIKTKSNSIKIPSIVSATALEKNYININVNDKSFKALVDSGSDICCIHKSLLKNFGLTTIENSDYMQVRGISGKLIKVQGTVVLNLQIGNASYTHRFYVFDNIHHGLIIGHDFLKDNKCTLNYETLEFNTGVPSVNCLTSSRIGLARLKGSVTLPPLSETLVPVRLSKLGHGQVSIVEPVQSLVNHNVALARAVIKSHHGKCACKLLNPLPFEVRLKSNVVVGKLLSVDEHSIMNFVDFDDTSSPNKHSSEFNHNDETSNISVNAVSEIKCDEIFRKVGISFITYTNS